MLSVGSFKSGPKTLSLLQRPPNLNTSLLSLVLFIILFVFLFLIAILIGFLLISLESCCF